MSVPPTFDWSRNGAECIQSWWVAAPPSSHFWQSSLFSLLLGIYLGAHLSSSAPLSRQTTCELCSAIFTSTLPSERGKAKNQQMELFTWLKKHPPVWNKQKKILIFLFLLALHWLTAEYTCRPASMIYDLWSTIYWQIWANIELYKSKIVVMPA